MKKVKINLLDTPLKKGNLLMNSSKIKNSLTLSDIYIRKNKNLLTGIPCSSIVLKIKVGELIIF
jgi:hypothetical protein